MSETATASADTSIRSFRIEVPQKEIAELRRRIAATRWPSRGLLGRAAPGRSVRQPRQVRHSRRFAIWSVGPVT